MKINKKVLMSSFLALTLLATAGVGSALAYQGDYTKQGPESTPERHEAMEEAFTNNDYSAWEELMNGRGRVTQVINADNFDRFVEAHQLAEEGRYDEADAIRLDLGLRGRDGAKVGAGYKGGNDQRGNGASKINGNFAGNGVRDNLNN